MNLKHVVKAMVAACAVLFLVSAAPRAHAATFTVTKLADTNDGVCDSDCSLREAMRVANSTAGDDTINFSALFNSTHNMSLDTQLDISGNVTITGPGASLLTVQPTTKGAFAIFAVVNDVSATLSGLTISNASNGIYNNYGTLTATNCIISDNSNGIYNPNNGTLTTTNCIISDNSIGIHNANNGTLTATNCIVKGNSNVGIASGNYQTNGTATVTNCTISGNKRGFANSSIATVTNCTLSGNTSGIENFKEATITNCTISDSIDVGIIDGLGTTTVINCTLSGNLNGIVNNGAISSIVTVIHCTVTGSNNSGITNKVAPTYPVAKMTVKSTLMAGNAVDMQGPIINGGFNLSIPTAAQAGLEVDSSGKAVLADNGGPTQTIKLLPFSPALDKSKSFGVTTDQRGQPRPHDYAEVANASGGDGSDIGAFEAQVPFVAPVTVAVNNPTSVLEGSADIPGSIAFDITLSQASTQTVTVKYSSRDGINNPATAGSDYISAGGTLTFAPGVTKKRVRVNFIGDSVPEASETFFLDLDTPTNATISDSRGVASIRNDDGPSLNIFDAVPVDEGNSGTIGQKFIVRLSAASADTVTVNWATASDTAGPDDYVAASGTLTFAPGQTSKLITIQVNGDTTAESNETYKVTLSKPAYAVLGDALAVGTIRNDDAMAQFFENDEPSS